MTDSYADVENPVMIRAPSKELYPVAAQPMMVPSTPKKEEKKNIGRFPHLVAKAEMKGPVPPHTRR